MSELDGKKGLYGLKVVTFESRLSDTMGGLIRAQDGFAVLAPSMKEVPLENNPEAFHFADKLFSGQVDRVILLTGVGMKSLLTVLETRHEREKILSAFRQTIIVPRGPKPIRVLKELNIPYALTVPEPNTWREILAQIDAHPEIASLQGKTVAVQEYGIPNEELILGLKERGANVLRVPVYRWALPDDIEPLQKAIQAIIDGDIHVAMFTTAIQIDHVLKVAELMNVKDELKEAFQKLVIASVGPDCTQALVLRGVGVDIEPESPKMGPLVIATAQKARDLLKR